MTQSQSNSNKPDLDWSQIRETVMMLNLAVARIDNAMRDGNDSIETLSQSFTSMADAVQNIEQAALDMAPCPSREVIETNCQQIAQQVHTTIVAFQFYDKLNQRLTHVSQSLSALTELVDDQDRNFIPNEWQQLQKTIRSQFTLDSDIKIFDAILAGTSLSNVLEMANEIELEEKIELF
jgi:ribosomal protein L16 Arg81 hydroxylase